MPPAYPKELKSIGDHLRKRRLDMKLLQREVAQKFGVDVCTVYNWEHNRAVPRISLISKIIEFLGYAPLDSLDNVLGKK